jgi:hypothetical protein
VSEEVCNKRVSVWRIALFPFRFPQNAGWGPYRPGSGRFCGGYPQEGIIQ